VAETAQTVRLLSTDGTLLSDDRAAEYLPYVERLSDEQLRQLHRDMAIIRRFDIEATNLQRQGQLALWPPSQGQEAAQVGSARATRAQDHIFPSYREHVIAMIRGVDLLDIVRVMRGVSHGGWDPAAHNNFHLYTLVLGSQALHATGYAMGIVFDGACATGSPETDQAVIVYFGDGATSQGDVSEALVFASSFRTPQVFFVQNNHWAISVPVAVQSRAPLYRRASGFGMPGVQVDGNDVLASYAVTASNLEQARAGEGPRWIEALTYRMGAHTTSDDPGKYRDPDELAAWAERDPIVRFEAFLRSRGEGDAFFAEVAEEAEDYAADIRARTYAIEDPGIDIMFDHVYSEPHPVMVAQKKWLLAHEAALGGEE